VTTGTVHDNLTLFRGVWHDVVSGHAPDGTELSHDTFGGTPGPLPYEQLVYLDVRDAHGVTVYEQTNVVLRGRDPHARTFGGRVIDGVLQFDRLGPDAPLMLGVSGGPGVLVFTPARVDGTDMSRFFDPDWIRHLGGDQRTRTTTLYRDGELRRVLTVRGTRISADPTRRVAHDPRGADGPVHDGGRTTTVYADPQEDS
jgi:hypothetical protein